LYGIKRTAELDFRQAFLLGQPPPSSVVTNTAPVATSLPRPTNWVLGGLCSVAAGTAVAAGRGDATDVPLHQVVVGRHPRVVQEDEQLVAVLEDAAADAQAVGPLYPLMATSP
jgi:hypothetical protein